MDGPLGCRHAGDWKEKRIRGRAAKDDMFVQNLAVTLLEASAAVRAPSS